MVLGFVVINALRQVCTLLTLHADQAQLQRKAK